MLSFSNSFPWVTTNILVSMRQVLLGDVGAGKSSLVLRFVKGQFVEFQVGTLVLQIPCYS